LIEGGFEEKSTNLIVGGSGSGKTMFGVQFLLEGMKNNENCLFISFEERKEAFYSNFKGIGIDLGKYESSGKFFFLEYTPQKVKTMLEEGGGAIEALVLTKNISRIVIDSISSFTLLFDKELEKKEAALALFTLLKSWNCTTVLIADEDSIDENESSKMIDQEVDSIILMHFDRKSKERTRSLEILKMRGTNHSLGVHGFKISDEGLVVNKAQSNKK
jgi:circadian clock protein KaiC